MPCELKWRKSSYWNNGNGTSLRTAGAMATTNSLHREDTTLRSITMITISLIKYRGAEVKPQPSPFPSLMFLRTQGANYAPRMGGRIPPKPPLLMQGSQTTLLEWGGGSPPNPPS